MPMRALRGATVAAANTETDILAAARELLLELATANALQPEQLISVLFTMTRDLDAAFPTRAARELGWTHVALLDAQQPHVAGDLPLCLRVLIHLDTDTSHAELKHIYLRAARRLRPDLAR